MWLHNITAGHFAKILVATLLLAGCQSLRHAPPTNTFTHKRQREQIVLHSEYSLQGQDILIQQLCEQRHQIASQLQLPTTEKPIHIYLFAAEADYYDFLDLRFPGFPPRRAIFVESDVELSIYAFQGDHTPEDLRHEVTHGYLHAAIPNLPLWLDEGLAEYFEVSLQQQPTQDRRLNTAHLDYFRSQPNYQPNLARLEQLASAADMTQQDYAESWAWVHFLFHSQPNHAHLLTQYLADLSQGHQASLKLQLQKHLPHPDQTLKKYIQHLLTMP